MTQVYFGGYDGIGQFRVTQRKTSESDNVFAIAPDGHVSIGSVTFPGNGKYTLSILNGTAPTVGQQPANKFVLWAQDIVAGNSAPHIMTENGDIIKIFRAAALTAQLTTITHSNPATDDFAISAPV